MSRRGSLALSIALATLAVGCSGDADDTGTWIARLRPETGELAWEVRTSQASAFEAALVADHLVLGEMVLAPESGGAVEPDVDLATVIGTAGDLILIDDGERVLALDRSDGSERWTFTLPGAGPAGWELNATVAGDLVLIGGAIESAGPSVIFGVDRSTGAEVWRRDVPGLVQLAPAPDDADHALLLEDTAASGVEYRTVHGVALADGTSAWHEVYFRELRATLSGNGRVVLLAPFSSTTLEARDVATGGVLWRRRQVRAYASDSGSVVTSEAGPTTPEGRLGAITVREPETGVERWSERVPDVAPFAATTSTILAFAWEGEELYYQDLRGLDAATGDSRWALELPCLDRVTAHDVAPDLILVGQLAHWCGDM